MTIWLWNLSSHIKDVKKIISTPNGSFIFKVNNRNTRTRCEMCSKLTIWKPERHHCLSFSVFIVSIVDFEQVNPGWDVITKIIQSWDVITKIIHIKAILLFGFWNTDITSSMFLPKWLFALMSALFLIYAQWADTSQFFFKW